VEIHVSGIVGIKQDPTAVLNRLIETCAGLKDVSPKEKASLLNSVIEQFQAIRPSLTKTSFQKIVLDLEKQINAGINSLPEDFRPKLHALMGSQDVVVDHKGRKSQHPPVEAPEPTEEQFLTQEAPSPKPKPVQPKIDPKLEIPKPSEGPSARPLPSRPLGAPPRSEGLIPSPSSELLRSESPLPSSESLSSLSSSSLASPSSESLSGRSRDLSQSGTRMKITGMNADDLQESHWEAQSKAIETHQQAVQDGKSISNYPATLEQFVANCVYKYSLNQSDVQQCLQLLLLDPPKGFRKLVAGAVQGRLDEKALYSFDNKIIKNNPIAKYRDQARQWKVGGESEEVRHKALLKKLKGGDNANILKQIALDFVGILPRPVRALQLSREGAPLVQQFGHVEQTEDKRWHLRPGTTLSSEAIKDTSKQISEALSKKDKPLPSVKKDPMKPSMAYDYHASLGHIESGKKLLAVRSGRSSSPELVKQKLIYAAMQSHKVAKGFEGATGFHQDVDAKTGKPVWLFKAEITSSMDHDFKLFEVAGLSKSAKKEERLYLEAIRAGIETAFSDTPWIDETLVFDDGSEHVVRFMKPPMFEVALSSAAQYPEHLKGTIQRSAQSAEKIFTECIKQLPDFKARAPGARGPEIREYAEEHWNDLNLNQKCALMELHILFTGKHITKNFKEGASATGFTDDAKRFILMARRCELLNMAELVECMSGKDRTGGMACIVAAVDGIFTDFWTGQDLNGMKNPEDLLDGIWKKMRDYFTEASDVFLADVIRLGNGVEPEKVPKVKWENMLGKRSWHVFMDLYRPHQDSPIGIT
jgi:hypothetical protein